MSNTATAPMTRKERRTARRAAKARDRARIRQEGNILSTYLPPEGVPLRFTVAGLAARLGAQITDILLCVLFIGALITFLATSGIADDGNFLAGLSALLFFAIRVPYYIATELFWNGQTLGKRIMGLRVISADGRTLSPHAITVRNMMKEAEVFGPGTALLALGGMPGWAVILSLIWIATVIAIPLFNRRRQRIGDMIAATYVVEIPKAVLLPELVHGRTAADWGFTPEHLGEYGAYELQTLERLLQVDSRQLNKEASARRIQQLRDVSQTIRRRIGFDDPVDPEKTEDFLRDFYAAQRAFLENRQLFGDRRADKFHKTKDSTK